MSFDEDVRDTDRAIDKGYLALVVNSYKPLFDRISNKARTHLESNNIPELTLSTHLGLIFSKDGNFYKGPQRVITSLEDLPAVYQRESDYTAGCADDRVHITPSVQEAMRTAINDFRDTLRRSLADTV